MADTCSDVSKALAELSRKIDSQTKCCQENKRKIDDLDRRLKRLEGGNKNQNNKNLELGGIYARLARLESYCLSIENILAQVATLLKPIISIFKL